MFLILLIVLFPQKPADEASHLDFRVSDAAVEPSAAEGETHCTNVSVCFLKDS